MLKITIETDERVEVIDLSPEEQKAFEFVANGPKEWIENAIRNRVRRAVDKIVEDTSDKNFKKMPVAEKLAIVRMADIESAKTRHERAIAEIGG